MQDETSFFLPVEALLAGTHRYLYHVGDFSEENCARMSQFLQEKGAGLDTLQQGKLSASERRSSALLRSYMNDLEQLLKERHFQDTLWQLHNARVALYQPLYVTEIPTYVRGKALLHRLEEFTTFPTAPGEHATFLSSHHMQLASQELQLIDQYLAYAEANASKFDDKQAIAERVVQARQYAARLHSKISHGVVDMSGPPAAIPPVPLLSEQALLQTPEKLTQEMQALNDHLAALASHLDPLREPVEVAATTLHDARAVPCDQAFIDRWMATSYQRLRSLFPGYKLRMVPVQSQASGPLAPYDPSQVVFLLGISLTHREPLCLLFPSCRWLSPEIKLMAEYFPGKAYIQTAIASWSPDLAFDRWHDLYIAALTLFELQNMAGIEDVLSPTTIALMIMQLLLEDTMARLDVDLIQKQVLPADAGAYLQQQLPWLPRDLVDAFSDIALLEPGAAAARASFRFKLNDMRKVSKVNGRKVSWGSFYQSVFEQGIFDPFQMRDP